MSKNTSRCIYCYACIFLHVTESRIHVKVLNLEEINIFITNNNFINMYSMLNKMTFDEYTYYETLQYLAIFFFCVRISHDYETSEPQHPPPPPLIECIVHA